MSLSVKVDDAAFVNALRALQKKVKVDGVRVVKNEAGLFVDDVVKRTPTFGKGQAAKKQGERVIGKEMGFIIQGRDPGYLRFVADTFGKSQVRQSLRRKDGKEYVIDMDHITFSKQEVKDFHRRQRSRTTGKVARAHSRQNSRDIGRHTNREQMFTTNKIKADVIKEKQARVGLAKAGWNASMLALKRTVPKWVKRHGLSHGSYVENGKTGNKFVLSMNNRLVYIPSYKNRIVDVSMKRRVSAMKSALRRVVDKGAGAYRLKKGL